MDQLKNGQITSIGAKYVHGLQESKAKIIFKIDKVLQK